MKLNIANPATGLQKTIDIEDERKVRIFYDKRISADVAVDSLGEEFKGYIMRIRGGNDKQGFPMKQGVLVPNRVKLLLSKGHSCYKPRRDGERRRKSVRGCIVGPDLSSLSLSIVKQGENDIPGLTDGSLPKSRGPIRATKIRRLFNLSPEDDVTQYVIRRRIEPKKEGAQVRYRPVRIQRLVTPEKQRRGLARVRKQQARRILASKQRATYMAMSREKRAEKAKVILEKKNELLQKPGVEVGKSGKLPKKTVRSLEPKRGTVKYIPSSLRMTYTGLKRVKREYNSEETSAQGAKGSATGKSSTKGKSSKSQTKGKK